MELDILRQLEDVQQPFEREHERHRKELIQKWQAPVIEKLKQELAGRD